MSEFQFSCPACGRDILADTSCAGKDITCPICKAVIVVPKENADIAPLEADDPPTPPDHGEPVVQRISGLAIASLVCSLSSLVTCIGWLPGIICGHLAKSRIRRNPALKGTGLATVGLIIGYLILLSELGSATFYIWRISTAVKQGYEHARQSLATNNFIVVQTQSATVSNETRPVEPVPSNVVVTNNPPTEPIQPATVVVTSQQIESGNPAWTSDIGNVSFPGHPVSGKLHGFAFALKSASFRNGDLRLRSVNDVELSIYRLGASIAGRNYEVQPDDDSNRNPRVKMTWQEGDAEETATFGKGYGMKLEFTQTTNRKGSGRIYLCLPDAAKSCVAGTFELTLPQSKSGQTP